MDWLPVVGGLVLVHGFLMILCFVIMNNRVQLSLITLDSKIASAIAKVIAEGMPSMEPINPVQAAIAQMLAGSVKKPAGALEILKDESGKFSGE